MFVNPRERNKTSSKLVMIATVVMVLSVCFSGMSLNTSETSGIGPVEDMGVNYVYPMPINDEIPIRTIEDLQRIGNGSPLNGKYKQMANLDFSDPDSYENMASYLAGLGWEIKVNVVSITQNAIDNATYDVMFEISFIVGGIETLVTDALVQYIFCEMNTGTFDEALSTGYITIPGNISRFDGATTTAFMIGGTLGSSHMSGDAEFAISMFVDPASASNVKTSYHLGNFDPIGVNAARFMGSYNGNVYTITGMEVVNFYGGSAAVTALDHSAGMFGVTNNANIENVKLMDGSVTNSMIKLRATNVSVNAFLSYAGGVAGCSMGNTKITNCFNDGTVAASSCAGGIVGYTTVNVITSYCTNNGRVTSQGNIAGGIVGLGSAIKNSINYGDITAGIYAGGIGAYISSGDEISNCINYGNITSFGRCAGGIAAYSVIPISSCINYGEIQGGGEYLGGIIGQDYSAGIVNVANFGSVTLTAVLSVNACVGGIAGTSTNIQYAYNHGRVETSNGGSCVAGIVGYVMSSGSRISNVANYGDVSGATSFVGGIVGLLIGMELTDATNTGNITGTANFVGGITGSNLSAHMKNTLNTGTVRGSVYVGGITGRILSTTLEVSANYGDVFGSDRVGGITGILYVNPTRDTVEVKNCYNVGEINGNTFVGGIAGDAVYGDGAVSGFYKITSAYNSGMVFRAGVPGAGGGILGGTGDATGLTVTEAYYPNNVTGGYSAGTAIPQGSFTSRPTFPSGWFNGSSVWAMDDADISKPIVDRVNRGMPYFGGSADFTVTVNESEQRIFHKELADPVSVSVAGTGPEFVEYQWQISEFNGTTWSPWTNMIENSNLPIMAHKDPILVTDPNIRYQCVVKSLIPNGGNGTAMAEIRGYYGLALNSDIWIKNGVALEYSFDGSLWYEYNKRVMLVDGNEDHITSFHVRGPVVPTIQGVIGWTDDKSHGSVGNEWAYPELIADNLILTAEIGFIVKVSVNDATLGKIEYRYNGTGSFADADGVFLAYGLKSTTLELRAVEKVGGDFVEWTGDIASGVVVNELVTLTTVNKPLVFVANFVLSTYSVYVTDSGGGTTTASPATVSHGGSSLLTFTPDPGRKLAEVLVDGIDVIASVVSGKYTISNITSDVYVDVTYEMNTTVAQYAITSSAGPNVTIDPRGVIFVSYGGSKTYTFTADYGHMIIDVVIDGESHPEFAAAGTYTFRNVNMNHSIAVHSVQYDLISLSIEIEGNGLVEYSIDGVTFVTYGGIVQFERGLDVKLRAFAGDNYQFTLWKSGSFRSTTPQVEFRDVTVSMFVTANFEENEESSSMLMLFVISMLIILAVIILLFLLFYRRSYDVTIETTGTAVVNGKERARRSRRYIFTVEGGGTVLYRVGEDGQWKHPVNMSNGEYKISGSEVKDDIVIEVR